MQPRKLILLEEINSIIEKSLFDHGVKSNDNLATSKAEKYACNCICKDQRFFSDGDELVKKLSQVVQVLEEEDDRLLNLIHFIFENLTRFVKDFISREGQLNDVSNGSADYGMNKVNHTKNGSDNREHPPITRREMDVLNLLAKGLCAKEIADNLFISETTVITHKKHLKEKFHAKNSVELISKALLLKKEIVQI
jgi:DNA-binding CsgD family transcriptional regulator